MSSASPLINFTQVTRRNFLAVGGAGVISLSQSQKLAASSLKTTSVIQIVLNGGASQFETFDPKPQAPREVRGPLRAIDTKIPGVQFSESLPKLAERADQLVIIRSLKHDAAPIHRTGLQLLACGTLSSSHHVAEPITDQISNRFSGRTQRVPAVVELGGEHNSQYRDLKPFKLSGFADPKNKLAQLYGKGQFAERFWKAARLVEQGVKYVNLSTFDQLKGIPTWDAHGHPEAPATIFTYRDEIGPQFDQAFAALLDDLQLSGLLSQTLIVCTGEMGRASRLNEFNGRDHWTNAWSGVLAGGGLDAGQVIGETDEWGEEIKNDPFPLAQIPAMVLEYLQIENPNLAATT